MQIHNTLLGRWGSMGPFCWTISGPIKRAACRKLRSLKISKKAWIVMAFLHIYRRFRRHHQRRCSYIRRFRRGCMDPGSEKKTRKKNNFKQRRIFIFSRSHSSVFLFIRVLKSLRVVSVIHSEIFRIKIISSRSSVSTLSCITYVVKSMLHLL